jgi:hypothetical protein
LKAVHVFAQKTPILAEFIWNCNEDIIVALQNLTVSRSMSTDRERRLTGATIVYPYRGRCSLEVLE